MCKSCGKQFHSLFASASGFLAAPGSLPLVPGRDLLGFVGPHAAALKTARDCLRLNCAGQAKSVRRPRKCCTWHTQVFHRRKSTTIVHEAFIFVEFLARNFSKEKVLHKSPAP